MNNDTTSSTIIIDTIINRSLIDSFEYYSTPMLATYCTKILFKHAPLIQSGCFLSLDFPLARHKDFFDGHSWASGLFQQANGKGQESSSEATNAYYGTHQNYPFILPYSCSYY